MEMYINEENAYSGSDLACEMFGLDLYDVNEHNMTVRQVGPIRIERVHISEETASHGLQRHPGTYVTFACDRFDRIATVEREMLCRLLAGELRGMAERSSGKSPDSSFGVFVAGLGNAKLTADAIGPKTVHRLTVTRHLYEEETELCRAAGCSAVSALAPGVLGQTGIESFDIVRGIVERVRPDVVVIVDALAARSCTRLASTVQLTDAGISPGSGIGNHRAAVNRQTLGVPVLVIGVPTVVRSSVLVYDALHEAGIRSVGAALHRVLEEGSSFFVSPKECDVICEHAAEIVSKAITLAFGGSIGEVLQS